MSSWYDQKVKAQEFAPGDEVYVLNLRLYQGKCPKWVRRYSDVATVIRRINQVTYIVRSNAWRAHEKVIHVDKLKLKNKAATTSDQPQTNPTSHPNLSDRSQSNPTSDRPRAN